MSVPRQVLKKDGHTLESFFILKAVMRRVEVRKRVPTPVVRAAPSWARTATPLRMLEGFTDDRNAIPLKILLLALIALLAALLEIVR